MSKYKKIPIPEKGQNAYVIVDEVAEIKEGDWCLLDNNVGMSFGYEVKQCLEADLPNGEYTFKEDDGSFFTTGRCDKLIATYGFKIDGVKDIGDEAEELSHSWRIKAGWHDADARSFRAGYQSHAATHPFSENDMHGFAEWINKMQTESKTFEITENGWLFGLSEYKSEELLTLYLSQPRYLSDDEVDKLLKK